MDNIEVAYINSFREGFEHQFQQRGSRLRPHFLQGTQSAEFDFWDRVGEADDVNEVTTRYGDTPMNDVTHSRRGVALRDFDWAKLVDKKDLIRVLTDPTNDYTRAAVWSFGRKVDDVIIRAAFRDKAITGKKGDDTISFVSTTAGQISKGNGETTEGVDIAVDYVRTGATAASNLTIDKLLAVRYTLLGEEALDDQGQLINAFVTSSQLWSLLDDDRVQSADYNTIRALAVGEINQYAGFRFFHTERLLKSGTVRECLFALPDGIRFVSGKELNVDVGPRRDKRNIPQIYINMTFNATRNWGEHVVRVNCDES